MCYARTTQQTSDSEPTLAQRWFTVYDARPTPHQNRFNVSCPPGTTYENMRADPPAKLRPRPKAASLLGHRLGRRPNNKTTSVRCPHPPGNAGISKHKPQGPELNSKSWTIVYDDDPTPLRHRPRASPAKHENVQPMSVQCCPIVFDAGPTLQQHRPHASLPPGYAYIGSTNAATR